jgi:hypothetical protein
MYNAVYVSTVYTSRIYVTCIAQLRCLNCILKCTTVSHPDVFVCNNDAVAAAAVVMIAYAQCAEHFVKQRAAAATTAATIRTTQLWQSTAASITHSMYES